MQSAAADTVSTPTDPKKRAGPGARRFGRFNWLGFRTLYFKEVRRFFKVYLQTLAAPVATSALFLAVFTLALASRRGEVAGMPFAQFLAPGLVMMTVIQNAFANSSSSLMVAKIQGNIVDTLMPPLSPSELTGAYALGGATRGLAVAGAGMLILFPLTGVGLAHPIWALVYLMLSGLILAMLGIIAGIWAEKFDNLSAITNFVITPLSFLSGTFYLVSDLPAPWATISAWNPMHFMIDGFRYGTLGVSEANPWLGAGVLLVIAVVLWLGCTSLFRSGYRLKS